MPQAQKPPDIPIEDKPPDIPIGETPPDISVQEATSAAKSKDYTGVFTGSHPFIEFLPGESEHPAKPHEMQIVRGVDESFDSARNWLANQASKTPFPRVAGAAASLATEPVRFAADILNDPFFLATGGLNAIRNVTSRIRGGTVPEVLPPEAPPPQRLLPAADLSHPIDIPAPVNRAQVQRPGLPDINIQRRSFHDPIVATETGAAQRESLVTPIEQARMAGFVPEEPGVPSQPIPPVMDTEAIAEARRQVALNYTGHELQGGTRLEIPDTGERYLRGTELGTNVEPRDSGSLQYPENIVPAAVRPRAAQEVNRALAPARFQEPVTPTEPVPLESFRAGQAAVVEPPVLPKSDLAGGTAAVKEGEPILPSAKVQMKASQAKANTGLNVEAGIKAAEAAPPAIKEGVAEFTKKMSDRPAEFLTTIYSQLGKYGEAGKELVKKFMRVEQGASEYDASWTEPLVDAARKLKKSEFANMGAYVEGRMPIPNQRVQAAVDAWKASHNASGDQAINVGLHLKRGEEVLPFQKISGDYWPHIPSEQLTKDDILNRMVSTGMPRAIAERIAKTWQKTGELIIGPQYSRTKEAFPYRDDFDVAIRHARSMSKRIAQHENLGPLDVQGHGAEGIADLIEQTTNPRAANMIAERLVGRGEKPEPGFVKNLNRLRKASSVISLPNFTLKNVILGQGQNAYMALISRHPYEVAKEVTKLFSKAYRDEARTSGALNSFVTTIAEEYGKNESIQTSRIGKLFHYGIEQGEIANRMVATAVGRATVREAFKDFQATGSEYARRQLEYFLARDPATITEMTPELERFGAGRMAEITQGLNRPGNLPYGLSDPVTDATEFVKQLAFIFKKTGIQINRNVKDSIMMQPTKAGKAAALAAWAATTQVAGEMTGDVASALTGKERPEDAVTRIGDNWGYAFFGGVYWELAKSAAFGKDALAAAIAGPVAGKLSEAASVGSRTMSNLSEGKEDPLAPSRKFIESNLPIPGRERIRDYFEGQ